VGCTSKEGLRYTLDLQRAKKGGREREKSWHLAEGCERDQDIKSTSQPCKEHDVRTTRHTSETRALDEHRDNRGDTPARLPLWEGHDKGRPEKTGEAQYWCTVQHSTAQHSTHPPFSCRKSKKCRGAEDDVQGHRGPIRGRRSFAVHWDVLDVIPRSGLWAVSRPVSARLRERSAGDWDAWPVSYELHECRCSVIRLLSQGGDLTRRSTLR
jgi:hypothetical protein